MTEVLYFTLNSPHPSTPGHNKPMGQRIDCMASHSKGFICAGSNGTLHLFEKMDDPNMYREVRTFSIAEDSVKATEDSIGPAESGNQTFCLHLTSATHLVYQISKHLV